LVSTVIKNWDNQTWLSSNKYIKSLKSFLTHNVRLNSRSNILDIGCGRGKILGSLTSDLKLKTKPIGIDIVNHKDKDNRIKFMNIDAVDFFLKNDKKFNLIIIKQTIHLLNYTKIKRLLPLCKNSLKPNGRVLIFTLDSSKNELPTFKLMKICLLKSLKRDKKIINLISRLYPQRKMKKFIFKVKIDKKKYLEMVQQRYISILLPLKKNEILKGIQELKIKYKNKIYFKDKLDCIIL
tara:strand:+ start:19 stop:729 length:711 start_codon:yes stop_codon:yes gene_type:complete